VDPGGLLTPHLPIPPVARPIIRGLHLAGTLEGVTVIEAQTRLPGPLLRLWPVAGFASQTGPWDLCLVRKPPGEPLRRIKIPKADPRAAATVWVPGDPPIHITLEGANPFRFTSLCPGAAEEAMVEGPSEGATLFLAAGRSPHLERLLPGLTPVRVEAGPDWADLAFLDNGRSRSVRWGAAPGEPGDPASLTLRLLYRNAGTGVPRLLRQFLPDGVPPAALGEIEASCRATEEGERCEGRLVLRLRGGSR